MNDWRSKPRTGRSQFNPLLDDLAERKKRGQTVRQMHTELTEQGLITLGYDQFIKYFRKAFTVTAETPQVRKTMPHAAAPDGVHPFATQASNTTSRRETDDSLHPSVPDLSKIYGKPD